MMDNYKRGYALSKYKEYSKLSDRDKRALTKDEKGAYISAMIAAYDVSRDETEISLEIQAATKDVFGTLLGDVFDEIGDIDDDKLDFLVGFDEGGYLYEDQIEEKYDEFIREKYYDWVCEHDHEFVAERVGLDLDACRDDEVDYTISL